MDRAVGHARGNGPGDTSDTTKVLATPETPFVIASASKAITAMLVHLLDDRGVLHVDDRVADYLPEFRDSHKGQITISHVMSHRAGIPNVPREILDLAHLDDREFIRSWLDQVRPITRPGRYVAYHAVSGGFVLGEIIREVTGKPIEQVLADEVLDPLGFRWGNYGVATADVPQVAMNYVTGPIVLPPLSTLFTRALGVPLEEVTTTLNDPRFLTGVVPAGNIVTTANELSRFFELLRVGGTLDGVEVFEPRTIRRAISEQSYLEIDLTLGFPFRYGMGFMLGAKTFSLYGPNTTTAFGHLGFTNIIGWADPERRVSGALLTSGKPIVAHHLYDLWDVMRQITHAAPADGAPDSLLLHA
jgi:CubicO group peptidase (beta-lactamase class C family)